MKMVPNLTFGPTSDLVGGHPSTPTLTPQPSDGDVHAQPPRVPITKGPPGAPAPSPIS